MLKQVRRVCLGCLAGLLAIAAHAAAQAPPLSLDAALAEALDRNPELVALRLQFDAIKERPAQVRSLPAPTFEAQIWQWPIATINPGGTNMYMFTLGQEFPGSGKRGLRESVAAKDVALAGADVAIRARQVIEEVKKTYADLFLARKAIEIQRGSVDLVRSLADAAQAKYTTGRMSQQDVLKAVLELSRLHDSLVRLAERAGVAEAQLNSLLDRPAGEPIGPLAEPRERLVTGHHDVLQQLALDHQPELLAARLRVERAEAELASVGRDSRPDLFVMGGYMLMPSEGDAWMARIGVSWPAAPWSRGGLDARKAEAAARVAAAKADVRSMENAVRLAIHHAYVRATSAAERAALLRTTVLPQSNQTLQVSRVAYQADRVEFLTIIDNERLRLDAELEYFRALSDLDQALADLERAVGTDLDPSMVATVNTEAR
jgi:outer membrane protein TolC